MSLAFVDSVPETGLGTVPETDWAELPPGPELGIWLAMVEWDALSEADQGGAGR